MINVDSSPRERLRPGLYVITPDFLHASGVYERVACVLRCGITALQYRSKTLPYAERIVIAKTLQNLCRQTGTPLIVNDDIDLALEINAEGVHLGRDDQDYRSLVANQNRKMIVGISSYDSLELAREGAAAGVDYVAFGSFFPSSTKPNAARAQRDLLIAAKQEFQVPIVAIGGITPHNASTLLDAGADILAVINSVFDQADAAAAVVEFNQLFARRNIAKYV